MTLRARPNQYPHHVYLGIKAIDIFTLKVHILYCGGTIISRWWILTASHCIVELPASLNNGTNLKTLKIVAVVGQNHVQIVQRENRYEVDLEKSVNHPEFSYNPFVNDISLLRLKQPLSLNGYVKPIPIANPDFKEEGELLNYNCVK